LIDYELIQLEQAKLFRETGISFPTRATTIRSDFNFQNKLKNIPTMIKSKSLSNRYDLENSDLIITS
jgi:hypothetical protein